MKELRGRKILNDEREAYSTFENIDVLLTEDMQKKSRIKTILTTEQK